MKIKPKYTDPETAPLKFLKLIRVTLWIGLLLNLFDIITSVSPVINWYGLIVHGVFVVLELTAISGLNRMDWSGVKAYWWTYFVQIGDGLLVLCLYGYYGQTEIVTRALGQITSGVIILVLTWIYFQKRRLLFTPIPEQYMPLMEKEKEALRVLTQEKEVESIQSAEEGQVLSRSESSSVSQTESQGLVAVSEQQPMDDRVERLESRFCWNCGSRLDGKQDFCKVCGKVVYKPEKKIDAVTVSTPKEEPVRKGNKRKGWIGVMIVLSGVALVFGVLLLSPPKLMPPTQTAENVLYLEVYNKVDECIGNGSGFLVEDRTTLVTNYHVMENAHYILAKTADGEENVLVNTVLAFDEEADLAVLKCSQEMNVQPLTLGNSDAVKQGDKIYAVGYPLGIANTLSDGIVGSKYVDELGVELLQITAPISEGSSGGALLNETGQVVGVVCAYYVNGQNMNLAVAVNQLDPLLEQKEEMPLADNTPEHLMKSNYGLVYSQIPDVLSLENILNESDDIYLWKDFPEQDGHLYSYRAASLEQCWDYMDRYAEFLRDNGYKIKNFSGESPDGKYYIFIAAREAGNDESGYPLMVRVNTL